MVAAATALPVIGIPRALKNLEGIDSLLSIVQMPSGVPVATVSIDGAKNAGLLAARVIGAGNSDVRAKVEAFMSTMEEEVVGKHAALQDRLGLNR